MPDGTTMTPEKTQIIASKMPEPIGGTVYGSGRQKLKEQIEQGSIPKSAIAVTDTLNLNNNNEEAENERRMRSRHEFERTQHYSEGKFESIVDLITDAPTEEERRYWTFFALERIIDYSDDWSGRINREELAKRVALTSPALMSLQNREVTPDSPEAKSQESLHKALTIVQDLDLVFDQWFAFYKKLAPTGKIFQLAFGQEPEYMPPERFQRIYSELPGFKEGDPEWRSMSEQVDIALRAYIYLALQSDPRWEADLNWYKNGAGFDKVFVNESTEKDWVRRLKLKTIVNERNELAYLRGREVEDLTPVDISKLDKIPAPNKFADPGTGATTKALNDTLIELVSGEKYKNDEAMKMQARIAVNLAEKTMRFFGIAAMYGTRGLEFNTKNEATKVAAEDYPWSDAWTDLMRPKDNITYNIQNSYYPGPVAWSNFAPEHIMVDFLRTTTIADPEHPEFKTKSKSAFELFRDGMSIGDIMKLEDRVGDWSYRAYLIRGLFSLREDSGVYPALNGDLERGENSKNMSDEKFFEDVEKSIHIVCRNWVVTKGKNENWALVNKPEIDAKTQDEKFLGKLREKYTSLNTVLTDEIIVMEAAEEILSKHIKMEKNKWKAIVWLNGVSYLSRDETVIAIKVASRVGFLDAAVLANTLKINFSYESPTLQRDFAWFIQEAKNSVQ